MRHSRKVKKQNVFLQIMPSSIPDALVLFPAWGWMLPSECAGEAAAGGRLEDLSSLQIHPHHSL